MGNRITNNYSDSDNSMKMSNGATSVFVSAIALSGSVLARSKEEIDLIVWLSGCDQNVLGSGTVGFDLSQLPWAKNEAKFNEQVEFIFRVVERINTKEDLGVLSYEPRFLIKNMADFSKLLREFRYQYIDFESELWPLEPDVFGKRCSKHRVYMHCAGCVVCNDSHL